MASLQLSILQGEVGLKDGVSLGSGGFRDCEDLGGLGVRLRGFSQGLHGGSSKFQYLKGV